MTDSSTENQPDGPAEGITDDQLPEDLQPSEDNPLAEPLTGDDAPDPADLDMDGGRTADESPEESPAEGPDADAAEDPGGPADGAHREEQ